MVEHLVDGEQWDVAVVLVVLIVAIAGYSGFKVWVSRLAPRARSRK